MGQQKCSFQIWEKDGSMKGPYCQTNYPPAVHSISNRLEIKYINANGGVLYEFVAYYESLGPIPSDSTFMSAFRIDTDYSEALAFFMSPLVNVPMDGYCLTFSYYMRSNLRVMMTSYQHTTTLANWVVDGGRAFHRAALDLPQGTYKLIWETIDGRNIVGASEAPYNRFLASVDGINIHNAQCFDVGRFIACIHGCQTNIEINFLLQIISKHGMIT